MSKRAAWFGFWLSTLLVACGGKVQTGSSDRGGKDPSASDSSNDTDSNSSSGSAQTKGDTELGDCTLGPAERYDEPCAWVADDRCYDSRDMACNCACPRNRDSQCASGFDSGPDGHVWVSCD